MVYKYYLFVKDELLSVEESYWGSYSGPPCGMTDYGEYILCTVNSSTPNKALLFDTLGCEFSSEDPQAIREYMVEHNLITTD